MQAPVINKKNAVASFREFEYLRITAPWEETSTFMTTDGGSAFAGRVFARYELSGMRNTCMDFQFRGCRLSDDLARRFKQMLSHYHHVEEAELYPMHELLGQLLGKVQGGRFVHTIESAKVSRLNGHPVLQIQWYTSCSSMRCVSVFIDAEGDGSVVHEIHFLTPFMLFERTITAFYDVMRSIQWKAMTLPPPLHMPRRLTNQNMSKLTGSQMRMSKSYQRLSQSKSYPRLSQSQSSSRIAS